MASRSDMRLHKPRGRLGGGVGWTLDSKHTYSQKHWHLLLVAKLSFMTLNNQIANHNKFHAHRAK